MGLPAPTLEDCAPTPSTSSPPETERTPRVGVLPCRQGDPMCGLIAQAGFEVAPFASIEELWTALSQCPPDLLVLDGGADDSGVLEICGEVRSREAGRFLPLVLTGTAETSEDLLVEGLLAGADDFCLPLARPKEFIARLQVQLRQKRVRDRLRRVRSERDHYRLAAKVDNLTGLLNRGSIDTLLAEAMTGDGKFAVLFIDVDHFKSINDRWGHDMGDEVLRRVAKCIEKSARGNDHCGRYGGEEFVVLVAGADDKIAAAVAERHRTNIESLVVPTLKRPVTVSVGVAVFEPERPDLTREALYRRADAALYHAKESGRNMVVLAEGAGVFQGAPDAPITQRSSKSSGAHYIRITPGPLPSVREGAPPPSAGSPPGVPRDASELEAQLLKAMARKAGLPLLPEAAQQALRLARDPSSDMPRIARLVERDPTLAARFLALANSPLYCAGGHVVSAHTALVRLGLANARDLLLQVVYERSRAGLTRYRDEVEASFSRSVMCALAAVEIGRARGQVFADAYLCGLLHDIGEGRVYRVLAEIPGEQPKEVVRRLVDRHHVRAGAEVARAWGLPEAVIDACENHHKEARHVSPRVRVIMAADLLAAAALCASEAGRSAPTFTPEQEGLLKMLDLSPKQASTILQGVFVAGRLSR